MFEANTDTGTGNGTGNDTANRNGTHGAAGRRASATSPESRARRAAEDVHAQHLWATYRIDPCDETRNALVENYLGFVRDIARRFAMRLPRSVDRGDLDIAANVGLMNAVAGFDPERGVRFESYCELRVKGALLDELRAQDWLPRPWRQKLEAQKRCVERLRGELGREPADDEVAGGMDMDLVTYQQVFGVTLPGTPAGNVGVDEDGEDSGVPLDVVPDRNTAAPHERLTQEEVLSLVTQRLTPQEYRVLYLRYWEGLPMREIGELTGLSESRVCKIHAKLIERLQDRFRAHLEDA